MDVLDVSLSDKTILFVTVLLVGCLLHGAGTGTDDYTYLRYLLIGGMYFAWVLFFNGLLATIMPSYYQQLQRETGATRLVIKLLMLLMSGAILAFMMFYAKLPLA